MPRPSNTNARRLQIIEAMMQVISENGYENASIQAIGKAAGLSSGLIHYHFKNKQEILIELIKSLWNTGLHRYTALTDLADTPEKRLNAFIDAALSLGDDSADEKTVAAWVVIGAEAIGQIEVQRTYQSMLTANKKTLLKILREYINSEGGSMSKPSLDALSTMIIASIEGAYQLSATAGDVAPRNYAAKTLKSMVFAYLREHI